MSIDPFLFFNDAQNPGILEPSDAEIIELDVIKTAEDQLFEAIEKTYSKDKLGKQQNFNAVCLIHFAATQLDSFNNEFRIKARIPELHTMIPNPVSHKDLAAVMLHPTFVGPYEALPNGPNTLLTPGTKVVVTFGNMDNFSEPKVVSVGKAPGMGTVP